MIETNILFSMIAMETVRNDFSCVTAGWHLDTNLQNKLDPTRGGIRLENWAEIHFLIIDLVR